MIQLDHNHHPSPLSPHQKNLAEHKILAWSDEQQNHYRPPQVQQKPSSPSPDKSSSLSPPPDETKQNVPAIASRQSTPLSELSPPPDDDDEPSKDEESPKPPSPATRDTPSLDVQSPSVSRAASSASPDSRIILVLELNQELLKVCMEMQAQNVNVSDPRYMAYSTRLQSNLTWLAGAADSRQVAMQLPVMDAPPPPVQSDLHSFPRIQEIYAEMPNIFASLISRQQQSMPGHTPFNSLKRERTEDGGLGDGMPMTKRRDTGESKPMMPPPPSFPMSNGNTQPLSDPGPGPGTPTSGDSMRERTRAAQMRAMQMNQQQMQRQMSPPSAQQQLQQQPNMNPGQPPNAPRMALTPQQLSTMPPQFQQAYQMLQNTSHPFMQQIMNAVPGFMQLPVQQQLQRMIGFQQQLRQQAQAQQQQQQQNQGIGGGPMMNGAGGGNGGFPGPSNPMAGQGQSSPMGMGMDPRSMGSPSIPGMMSSGGGGGGPSGMQGGGGMPGGPNMNQRQFMLMQQQQQARNQAPSQQGFQGQGMGMGVGGGGGMSPQQMAFQQQQERMRMEQERVREQQRMQQQQQQSPSMASPHLSAGSGGVPDSFPALRSNSTIPGIARSTRSPSEGAPSPMTPRMRSSMGQEDFQRMMMQQQQQQQQHRQNPMPQNQFSPQQMNWQQQQQQMGGGGFGPGQGMSRPSSGAGYGAASPPSVGPQNNWGVGGMTGGGMGYGFGAGEMDMMGQPRHPAPPNPDMSGMPSDIDFNWT